jgi:hypothetical protein
MQNYKKMQIQDKYLICSVPSQDIAYPTDLNLLSDAREKAEDVFFCRFHSLPWFENLI